MSSSPNPENNENNENNSDIIINKIFFENIHLFFGKSFKLNLVRETFDNEGYSLKDSMFLKNSKSDEIEKNLLMIADTVLKDVFNNIKNDIGIVNTSESNKPTAKPLTNSISPTISPSQPTSPPPTSPPQTSQSKFTE